LLRTRMSALRQRASNRNLSVNWRKLPAADAAHLEKVLVFARGIGHLPNTQFRTQRTLSPMIKRALAAAFLTLALAGPGMRASAQIFPSVHPVFEKHVIVTTYPCGLNRVTNTINTSHATLPIAFSCPNYASFDGPSH